MPDPERLFRIWGTHSPETVEYLLASCASLFVLVFRRLLTLRTTSLHVKTAAKTAPDNRYTETRSQTFPDTMRCKRVWNRAPAGSAPRPHFGLRFAISADFEIRWTRCLQFGSRTTQLIPA